MYDLRIKGMNLARWDEEFVINEYAHYLLRPNVLILFEILDFNPGMIFENRNLLNADLFYPVAWGYLRPVGTAYIHMANTRIQLYKHKFKYDDDVKLKQPYDPRTPSVLMEFNWPKKEQYPSFLEIETSFTLKSDITLERQHISRMPWEKEIGLESFERIESRIARPSSRKEVIDQDINKMQLLKRWEKFADFPSELPDTKVWKFDTEALGSFKLKFSKKGKYMAVACTQQTSKTLIKIFDVENGEIKIILRGHHDLVHDLQWSHDDNFLVSSSADCSVKVWNLTQKDIDYADKLNYTENDVMYYLTALLHPSYAYAA
jgi:jouberin